MSNKGKIHILCSEGMVISIDDTDAGISSPAEKGKFLDNIEPGIHFLEIKKAGYGAKKVKVQVKARQVSQVIIQEEVKKMKTSQQGEPVQVIEESLVQQTGSLKIITIPAWCKIDLMGETYEKTKNEIIFEDMPVGNKKIEFITGDKRLQCNVDIEDNKTKELIINFITEKILAPEGDLEYEPVVLPTDLPLKKNEEITPEFISDAIEEIIHYDGESSLIDNSKELEPIISNAGSVEDLLAYHEEDETTPEAAKTDEMPVQLILKDFPRSYNNDKTDQMGNKFFNNQTVTIFITGTSAESSYYTSFKLVTGQDPLNFDRNISHPEYSVKDGNISIMLKEGTYRIAMRYEKMEERKKSYVIECRVKKAVAGEKIVVVPDGNNELAVTERVLLKLAV